MFNVTCVGNIGHEPKKIENGVAFSLAVKMGHGQSEKTEWVSAAVFGKRAEALRPYLTVGKKLVVVGEAQLKEYTKRTGEKVVALNVVASNISFAESKQPAPSSAPSCTNHLEDDFGGGVPF